VSRESSSVDEIWYTNTNFDTAEETCKHESEINIKRANIIIKTTKFMSNVLEAISKLKLKNSKNHFSNPVLYLPAYSYTGIWNYIRNNL